MKYLSTLAAANYNCENTDSSGYGEGGYGTCTTTTDTSAPTSPTSSTSAAPGAPNTGFFSSMVSSGAFSIILPLVVVIILTALATILIRKKRTVQK